MELIIKPTGRCNFACTFCSANPLKIAHPQSVPDPIKNIINILKPNGIVCTGGEPLLVPKEYYEELLTLGDFTLGFTSNLKAFYENPEYWTPLLTNPRVSIGTSFQYGTKRRWDANTVYTEEKFIEVQEVVKKYLGHTVPFIAIIDEENEQYALDHLRLAKRLDTQCKLNPMRSMGLSHNNYPYYKMIDIWKKAKEEGLWDYIDCEIQNYKGGCGWNTSLYCESTIRACYVDENGQFHFSNCEDYLSCGGEIPVDKESPKPKEENISVFDAINNNCLSCDLYRLCNGCKISREANKKDPNFCEEMLKRKDYIMGQGWKLY